MISKGFVPSPPGFGSSYFFFYRAELTGFVATTWGLADFHRMFCSSHAFTFALSATEGDDNYNFTGVWTTELPPTETLVSLYYDSWRPPRRWVPLGWKTVVGASRRWAKFSGIFWNAWYRPRSVTGVAAVKSRVAPDNASTIYHANNPPLTKVFYFFGFMSFRWFE